MNIRQKTIGFLSVFLLFMTALGCGEASGPLGSTSCAIGQSVNCPCPDGSIGTSVCTEFGAFSACQCNSAPTNNYPTEQTANAITSTGGTTGAGSGAAGTAQPPVVVAQNDAATSPIGPTNPPTNTGASSGTDLSILDAGGSSDGAASNTTASAAGSNEPADPVVTTDPGVESGTCITAQSAADFTLMDQNSRSPTSNQMRSLHDICGKVLVVMYTSFH